MEKILDENDKIKRAEEIYYRRNNLNYKNEKEKIRSGKGIGSKISFHLLLLINITIVVFSFQNKDYIFSEEFLSVISEYSNKVSVSIIGFFKANLMNESGERRKSDVILENIVEDKIEDVNSINQENKIETISSSINEMETDVANIKNAYNFVKPIDGVISSEFGARESEYQNVTGYHTGIDIAAEEGKSIYSAIQGIVELVSSEGDYGKHIKIRCNNVTTLYAHCSKILVTEGQIVAEGQEIAKVGSTGNSTGPHLHFEIRVDDRFVNPSKLIKF